MNRMEELREAFEQHRTKRFQSEKLRWEENEPALTKNPVFEAMYYATEGGKRVRPLLLLLSYEACCASTSVPEHVFDFALALECIHAYSLIHDDLPCMDDDNERRGRPSTHVAFGEWQALLAGDGLLNYAFSLLLKSAEEAEETERIHCVRAGYVLAEAAGLYGMLGGQVLDLSPQVLRGTDAVSRMVEKKTAALFRGACKAGALLAGVEPEDAVLTNLDEYARCLGLAFQAKDDLMDRKQDEKEEKITLISNWTVKETEEHIQILTARATAHLTGLACPQMLEELAEQLVQRRY